MKNRLGATWQGGIAARLAEALCLQAAGGFETGRTIAAHYNWVRFAEKLAGMRDPLFLDRERFLSAVLSGKVTVYDISPVPLFTVSVDLPFADIPDGTVFISDWPGYGAFSWLAGQTVSLAVIEGRNRFFGPEGFITVQTEKGKITGAFYSKYSLQD
jgi:hypothetical protein